jgi:hypothetical protein
MDKNMRIDSRILNELSRHNSINKYITEQEATLPPAPGDESALPPAGEVTEPVAPAAPEVPAQPVDVEADPEVEKIDGKDKGKEELEITDLVKSQQNVEKKQEEYFENLFKHLTDLENKLGEMDNIVNKLNSLEAKIEKYRVKTPEEKLELRTLDSGPYNQKLSDFFIDKQEDIEKSGKNEYILTKDEVEEYSPHELKKTFRNFGDEGESFSQVK